MYIDRYQQIYTGIYRLHTDRLGRLVSLTHENETVEGVLYSGGEVLGSVITITTAV